MRAKSAVCLFLAAIATASAAADQTGSREAPPPLYAIPGEKIDSGLGDLPPLSEWREPWLYAIPAEKIDSGLGGLPPLSQWREPWLYAIPAEKIDSGLGDLPPLSQWREPWLHAIPADGHADGAPQPPAASAPSAEAALRAAGG